MYTTSPQTRRVLCDLPARTADGPAWAYPTAKAPAGPSKSGGGGKTQQRKKDITLGSKGLSDAAGSGGAVAAEKGPSQAAGGAKAVATNKKAL
jgi:hypothetical protein